MSLLESVFSGGGQAHQNFRQILVWPKFLLDVAPGHLFFFWLLGI